MNACSSIFKNYTLAIIFFITYDKIEFMSISSNLHKKISLLCHNIIYFAFIKGIDCNRIYEVSQKTICFQNLVSSLNQG